MSTALSAIRGGIGDVFSARLGLMALACLVVALAISCGLAWGAFHWLLPMIPQGSGWMHWLWGGLRALAGTGVVILAVVLAPAMSMIVGGALFDIAAERMERHLGMTPGRAVSVTEGIANGFRIGLPALALNLLSIPVMFVPVANIVWFLVLNGWLMGREYSAMTAIRRMDWDAARRLRSRDLPTVFLIGLACSLVPLVAPLVGAGAMTRWVRARQETD